MASLINSKLISLPSRSSYLPGLQHALALKNSRDSKQLTIAVCTHNAGIQLLNNVSLQATDTQQKNHSWALVAMSKKLSYPPHAVYMHQTTSKSTLLICTAKSCVSVMDIADGILTLMTVDVSTLIPVTYISDESILTINCMSAHDDLLCACTSTGHALFVDLKQYKVMGVVKVGGSVGTDVVSCSLRKLNLVTCHSDGSVVLSQINADYLVSLQMCWNQQCDGMCLTVLSDDLFCVGTSKGVLLLFTLNETIPRLVADINAHAGCILSLCSVTNSGDMFLCSSSQDQCVLVWKLRKSKDGLLTISCESKRYFRTMIPHDIRAVITGNNQLTVVVGGYGVDHLTMLSIDLCD